MNSHEQQQKRQPQQQQQEERYNNKSVTTRRRALPVGTSPSCSWSAPPPVRRTRGAATPSARSAEATCPRRSTQIGQTSPFRAHTHGTNNIITIASQTCPCDVKHDNERLILK